MKPVARNLNRLGPRYTKPGLQGEKNRAHHKYKQNVAMTDCLQSGYSITRQSVIAISFLYLWWARFFSASSLGLVYLGPYAVRSSQIVQWNMSLLATCLRTCVFDIHLTFTSHSRGDWVVICNLIYEGFHDKTRYAPFLKSWDKGQKLLIYIILQPLVTSSVYICNISNKAKVVGGRDY